MKIRCLPASSSSPWINFFLFIPSSRTYPPSLFSVCFFCDYFSMCFPWSFLSSIFFHPLSTFPFFLIFFWHLILISYLAPFLASILKLSLLAFFLANLLPLDYTTHCRVPARHVASAARGLLIWLFNYNQHLLGCGDRFRDFRRYWLKSTTSISAFATLAWAWNATSTSASLDAEHFAPMPITDSSLSQIVSEKLTRAERHRLEWLEQILAHGRFHDL